MTQTDELIIDETNFDQYFFDARKNKPKQGQVLACFESLAELHDGQLKQDMLNLLVTNPKGSEFASRLLQKVGCALESESYKVTKAMLQDMLNGMSESEILAKPYEYACRLLYYTQHEYVPQNDKRWWSTSFIDTRIVKDEESLKNINTDNK